MTQTQAILQYMRANGSITPVKALREAGITTVGELMSMPDEHSLKQPGIAEKSLAQIRGAVARLGEQTS